MNERIPSHVAVTVSGLRAEVPEGIAFQWQGREMRSGPLQAMLDETEASFGSLDYAGRRAELQFHVKLEFPQFARLLSDLGVDPAMTAPVRAVIHSSGDILPDHSFALDGPCEVHSHRLMNDPSREAADHASAAMLPGT